MKKIVGMDMDGVLANWNDGARSYFARCAGRDLCTATTPDRPTWNWPEYYGYSKEECRSAYADMSQSTTFWSDLDTLYYAMEALSELGRMQEQDLADVYFITTRPGKLAKLQTEAWLEGNGYDCPTVLIAPSPNAKAQLAAGLGLTHMIDDRTENCLEIKLASPQTQVFCLSAGWNIADHERLQGYQVNIVQCLREFIEVLCG